MQNKIDKENLWQVIVDSPKQFKVGFESAENIKLEGSFSSLIVSGMGGSALPADILKTYLNEQGVDLEIIQNRGYKLPKKAYQNSLNFFNSYSGNTEETLASLEEALKNNLPSVAFASG
jgi:glucose/mannose-6-phosphate isomerase